MLKAYIREVLSEMSTRYKREKGENLPRWQEKLKQYETEGNLYVHFGSIPKLGINPQNTYGTPTGIYAYPMNSKYIEDFATDNPYIFILRINDMSSILVLEDYTEDDLNSDLDKLEMRYPDFSSVIKKARNKSSDPGAAIWETVNDLTQSKSGEEQFLNKKNPAWLDSRNSQSAQKVLRRSSLHSFIQQQGDRSKAIDSLGFLSGEEVFKKFGSTAEMNHFIQKIKGRRDEPRFLHRFKKRIIQTLSALPESSQDIERQKRGENYIVNSISADKTKIFRELGYSGVVDGYGTAGSGIIHPNEPTQAVFFTTEAVTVVEMIQKPKQETAIHWQAKRLVTPPKSGGDYSGMEIKGETLHFEKYVHANLKGAAFRSTLIKSCDFSGANMNSAILYKVSTEETLFHRTNLKGALIGSSQIEAETDFQSANMEGCNFSDSELSGCNLNQVNLSQGRLSRLICNSVDFAGSNLTNSEWVGCSFDWTQFTSCTLDGTKIHGSSLNKVDFSHSTLNETKIFSCDWIHVSIRECTLNNVTLSGQFGDCDFSGSTFHRVRLTPDNGDLSRVNLSGVTLSGNNYVYPLDTKMPSGYKLDVNGKIERE